MATKSRPATARAAPNWRSTLPLDGVDVTGEELAEDGHHVEAQLPLDATAGHHVEPGEHGRELAEDGAELAEHGQAGEHEAHHVERRELATASTSSSPSTPPPATTSRKASAGHHVQLKAHRVQLDHDVEPGGDREEGEPGRKASRPSSPRASSKPPPATTSRPSSPRPATMAPSWRPASAASTRPTATRPRDGPRGDG